MITPTPETLARAAYVEAAQAYVAAKLAYESDDHAGHDGEYCPYVVAYYKTAVSYATALAVYIRDHRPALTEHIRPMMTIWSYLAHKMREAHLAVKVVPKHLHEQALLVSMQRQRDYQEVSQDVIAKAEELLAAERPSGQSAADIIENAEGERQRLRAERGPS